MFTYITCTYITYDICYLVKNAFSEEKFPLYKQTRLPEIIPASICMHMYIDLTFITAHEFFI